MTPLGILKGISAGLFVLALPVLFGTNSLRWLVSDTGGYRAGFEKYGVSARTGIAPGELARAADQISSYLLLEQNSIDMSVRIRGEPRPLFNDREIRHMGDVRNLLGSFYTLQAAAGGYALVYLLASALALRGGFRSALGRRMLWGGGATVGLFGVLGLLSLLDFDSLFLRFHLISFDNDLWILDPTKDNLIMMFPQGFWYDSAIRLAMATGAQALAALLIGGFLRRQPSTVGHQQSASR